jgi:large conductance mechanosensitive channel
MAETNIPQTQKNAQGRRKGKIRSIKDEFMTFLWDYQVMGLAIGVIIGGSVNVFVQSLVSGVITPFIQLFIPSEAFRDLSYTFNGVTFAFGPLLSSFLNLLLIALIIFLSVKYVLFRGGKIEREKISRV